MVGASGGLLHILLCEGAGRPGDELGSCRGGSAKGGGSLGRRGGEDSFEHGGGFTRVCVDGRNVTVSYSVVVTVVFVGSGDSVDVVG